MSRISKIKSGLEKKLPAPNQATVEKVAHRVKFLAQMAIGFLVFIVVFSHAIMAFTVILLEDGNHIPDLSYPLEIVSYGLGVSAGIEMAYMLFTPGPDEAVDPVILGLSATFLYVLSLIDINNPDILIQYSLLIISISFSIGGLFYVKERFITKKDGARNSLWGANRGSLVSDRGSCSCIRSCRR